MRILLVFVGLVFTLPLLGVSWSRSKIDMANRTVDQILLRSIEGIELKYGIKCVGTGAAMFGGPLRGLNLSFRAVGPQSRSDLRRMTVGCIQEIIDAVSSVPNARNILHHPTFDINNIYLDIFISDRMGYNLYDPNISSVATILDQIHYRYADPDRLIFPFKHRDSETYEEALEAIRREDEELQT